MLCRAAPRMFVCVAGRAGGERERNRGREKERKREREKEKEKERTRKSCLIENLMKHLRQI